MPQVQPSFGTQFWLEDPLSPTLLQFVADIMDVSGPAKVRETTDVTTHQSPDGYREHIGTLKDGGEVSFQVRFDPADSGHILLQSAIDRTDGRPLGARVYWPTADGDYAEFTCIPTGMTFSAPVSGILTADFTAKVSGPVDLYNTSSPSTSGLYT
jgi:hypothetical protein